MVYKYEEFGDFVDFFAPDQPVVPDSFISDGVGFGFHAGGGLRFGVSDDFSIVTEGRYFWSKKDLGDDFSQNRIDLGRLGPDRGLACALLGRLRLAPAGVVFGACYDPSTDPIRPPPALSNEWGAHPRPRCSEHHRLDPEAVLDPHPRALRALPRRVPGLVVPQLPEINDILRRHLRHEQSRAAWLSVAMTTLGSVAGCLVLYWIGRRGGEALLVKPFGEERAKRARAASSAGRSWPWPCPPSCRRPCPSRSSWSPRASSSCPCGKFVVTILIWPAACATPSGPSWGRSTATRPGACCERSIAWFARHLPAILVGMSRCCSSAVAGYFFWRRRRAAPGLTADAP